MSQLTTAETLSPGVVAWFKWSAAESPVSVEGRRNVARSVASRIPCDVQERTSAVVLVTEVVPPPSVCSTAVGPPRRTSPPPDRPPPLTRTPAPPDGEHWACYSNWRSPYKPLSKSAVFNLSEF